MRSRRQGLRVVVGPCHQRLHPDGGDQLFVGVVGRIGVVVEVVVIPAIRLVIHHLQPPQPLHRPVARPARNQQSDGGAVQVFQQLPVLSVRQYGVRMQRLLQREPLVVKEWFGPLGGRGWHALVPTLGADVRRPSGEPRGIQHCGQRHTRPLAAREYHPLLCSRRTGSFTLEIFKIRCVAARTLHHGTHRTGREAPQLGVIQVQRIFHFPVHRQRPVCRGHRFRNPEVLHHIVQFGRRD